MERMHKRAASVTPVPLGDETTADLLAGETVIPLSNSGDFYEDGGSVRIDGTIYTYSAVEEGEDDDAPEPSITLDAGLDDDLPAGSFVEVWNPSANGGAGDVVAEWMVRVTDDTDGSPGIAYLRHDLIPYLPEGLPPGVGDSVAVEVDEFGDWTVVDILGRTPTIDPSYTVNDDVSDPVTAPGVVNYYEKVDTGLTDVWGLTRNVGDDGWVFVGGDGTELTEVDDTGAVVQTVTLASSSTALAKVGSHYYVYHAAAGTASKYDAAFALVSTVSGFDTNGEAFGTDGTNLLIAVHTAASTSKVTTWTTAGVLSSTVSGMSSGSDTIRGVYFGLADATQDQFVLHMETANPRVFDATGVRQTALEWPAPGGKTIRGMTWDGTHFWTIATDGAIRRYENDDDAPEETYDWAYAWCDDDTHTTAVSPIATKLRKKRAQVRITAPVAPQVADSGDHIADHVAIYGAVTNNGLHLQTTLDPGVTSVALTAVTTTGTDAPTSNSFLSPDGVIGEGAFRESVIEAVWTEIDNSRLNDGVLSARFQTSSIFVPANDMKLTTGTPSDTVVGQFIPIWRLDATTDEGVAFSRKLPAEWATFDIVVRGANMTTGTGNVRLVVTHDNEFTDGLSILDPGETAVAATFAAEAQFIRQSITARTNLVNDSTRPHVIRILRDADHADDTLTNDWGLLSVELIPKTFVTFTPSIPAPPEDLSTQAFTEAMNADLAGLRVWHQINPPPDDTDDDLFKFWPGTDFAGRQASFGTSTWTGGDKWAIVWDNRCNYGDAWVKEPNPVVQPLVKIGTRLAYSTFSTREMAMAATRVQVRYLLGMTQTEWEQPWVDAGGDPSDIISDATFRASPETYCTTPFTYRGTTYQVSTDVVVLHPFQLDASDAGIQLDYEAHDTRTVADTTAHITAIADDCHTAGKELVFYTNPLTSDIQAYSGLDATNYGTILDEVDYFSVLLWSGAAEGSISDSWDAQIALLGTMTTARWAKTIIVFELGAESAGTTLEDAEWVYDKLTEAGTDHPSIVMFWRNGALHGGSLSRLTNRKISMVCFGTEMPPS